MFRNPVIGVVALGLAAVTGAPAAATYEGGLLLNHVWLDPTGDSAKGFGVSLDGLRLHNAHEGVSLRISRTWMGAGSLDIDRDTITAGYWRYLDGDGIRLPGLRPYINGAIGFGRLDAGAADDSGLVLEAAGGVVSKTDVLIPNLRFRSELRLGWDDAGDGNFQIGIGAGLHYAFGGAAPVARPEPAPARPRTPAPAPKPAATSNDTDGDGVPNSQDACPDTPAGTPVDARGCVDVGKVVLKGVSFETASANLKPEAMPILRSVVATLKANPGIRIEVQGHSDSQGEPARNMTLSERRAQAVKSLLVKEGIAGERILVKGFGETAPVASNATAEGRASNRRVEFKILNK